MSWFNLTESRFKTDPFYKGLETTVYCGEDPLMYWADEQGLSNDDMATILGCEPHEYKLHVESCGLQPHSPLSGQHVLSFCLHTKIHPANLAPSSYLPQKSCAPHIFSALSILAKGGEFKADRDAAASAIKVERERYKRFIQGNVSVAAKFEVIQAHANGQDIAAGSVTREAVRGMSKPGLQAVKNNLLNAFEVNSRRKELMPSAHADDFHTTCVNGLIRGREQLQFFLRKDSQEEKDVRTLARFIYGPVHSNAVLRMMQNAFALADSAAYSSAAIMEPLTGRVMDIQNQLSSQDIMVMLKEEILQTFEVKDRNLQAHAEKTGKKISVSEFVSQLIGAAKVLHGHQARTKDFKDTLERAVNDMKDFENWYVEMQRPENFYVTNLYCNHVVHTQGTQIINSQSRQFVQSLDRE